MESGRQSRDVGPFLAVPRMDAAQPEAALPPVLPEALINLDIDRNGRAVARPGSHFISRLGDGPVLGMHEHTFEFGDFERELVAVVHDAYGSVHAGPAPDDPSGGGSAGFCPDVTQHGQPLSPINARPTDRFHFASFLNRLYFAGSSVGSALHVHNFSTGATKVVEGIKCRSVVAAGNRIYVAGDPAAPNLLYPSDPDDPTTFQPQLAIQVGNRTDGIVGLREHEGMVVIFGERSCSWALFGAIELGDVQVESFTSQHGVVGPTAHAEAGDGYLYWISRSDGMVRWRRGMASPDAEFAGDAHELLETVIRSMSPAELRSSTVAWDPARQAVRFEVPGANLLFSYFPYQQGAWTVGASTDDTATVALLREYETLDIPLGADRYTALANWRYPFDDNDRLYGGDSLGRVWVWRHFEPDKVRTSDDTSPPVFFDCMIRWGNVELAPLGYRSVVENLLIDYAGGYQFSFEVQAEVDYDGFQHVETVTEEIAGGLMPLFFAPDDGDQDETRLMSRRLHPMHVRVGNWDVLVGKVFRFQMKWDCLQHMGFIGMELEESPEAEDAFAIQYPPDPDGAATRFGDEEDGSGTFVDNPTEPHDPAENPNKPFDSTYTVSGSIARAATDEISFVRHDQTPVLGNNLSFVYNRDSWTNGGSIGFGHLIVGENEVDVWALPYDDGSDRELLHFTVDPEFGTDPVLDYFYDLMDDALTAGLGADLGTFGIRGAFYFEGSDELWVFLSHRGGDNNKYNTLVAYDVSTRDAPPSAAYAENMGTSFLVANFIDADSRGYIYVGRGGAMEVVLPVRSGGTITSLAVQDSALGIGGGQNDKYTTRIFGTSLLVIANQTSDNVLFYDISDPTNLVLLDTYNAATDGLGAEERPFSPTFSSDGQTLFLGLSTSQNASGIPTNGQAVLALDISDLAGAGATRLGAYEDLTFLSGGEYGSALNLYSGPADEDAVLFWAVDGQIVTLDVSTPSTPTLIDSNASNVFQPYAIGMAGGPHTVQFSGGGLTTLEPEAVSANLAAMMDGGQVVLVGTGDTSEPVLEAFMQHRDLLGKHSMKFAVDGQHLFLLGGRTGKLYAYALGSDFGLAGELEDSRLFGADGMMVDLDERTVWALNGLNQLVEIDVSDPTAPSITGATDAGPPGIGWGKVLNPWGLKAPGTYQGSVARIVDRFGGYAIAQHHQDFFFINMDTGERHELSRPESQRKLEFVDMDATYVYGLNWWGHSKALAIVDHTDDLLPTVGYLQRDELGFTADLAYGADVVATWSNARHQKVLLGLDDIYLWDVSTRTAPVLAGSINFGVSGLPGSTGVAMIGSTLIVGGSGDVAWNLRIYNVSNPAAPSLTDSLAGTDVVQWVTALGNGTHVVGWDGTQWVVYDVSGGTISQVGTVTPAAPSQAPPAAVDTNKLLYYGDGAIHLLDCSTPASPSVTGSHDFGPGLTGPKVIDSIGGQPTGDHVVTIDRTNLLVLANGPITSTPGGVLTVWDCTGAAPVQMTWNVSDMESGALAKAAYSATGRGTKLIVARDIFGKGVSVLDTTGGNVTVDRLVMPFYPTGVVHVKGANEGVVYEDAGSRFYRADLTDFTTPRVELPFAFPEGAPYNRDSSDLSADGNVLFVGRAGDPGTGVYAYDVTTPSAATRLGRYVTEQTVLAVKVSGQDPIVYAIEGRRTSPLKHSNLLILDFTDTANPTLVGSVELPLGFVPKILELY